MLTVLLEVTMALLTVYGMYCLIINITYLLLCREKTNVCIAYFKNNDSDCYSNMILAKKAFLGRARTIILVDCNSDDSVVEKIVRDYSGLEIYRAERIKRVNGEEHR